MPNAYHISAPQNLPHGGDRAFSHALSIPLSDQSEVVAKVVSHSGAKGSARGVILGNRFYAMVLPAIIPDGTEIAAKVIKSGAAVTLEFEHVVATADPKTKALQALIASLFAAQQKLGSALSNEAAPLDRAEHNLLSRLADSLSLIDVDRHKDPEILAEKLRQTPLTDPLSDLPREVLRPRAPEDERMLVIREKTAAVRLLLRQLIPLPKDRQCSDAVATPGAALLPPITSLSERIEKIVLKNLPCSLTQLLDSQLERLKESEESVRAILGAPFDDAVCTLRKTISAILTRDAHALDPCFRNWLSQLQQNLLDRIADDPSEGALVTLLKEALHDIYKTFHLPTLEERAQNESAPPAALSPRAVQALKSLEVQLRSTLSALSVKTHNSIGVPLSDQPYQGLAHALAMLKQELPPQEQVSARLAKLIDHLESALTDLRAPALPDTVRQVMLQELHAEVKSLLSGSIAERPAALSPATAQALSVIREQIAALLATSPFQKKDLAPLTAALRSLQESLPPFGSFVDDELLEASNEVLGVLERVRQDLPQSGPLLARALENLSTTLEKNSSDSVPESAGRLSSAVFENLSSLLQGQQHARALQPLLQAAGDPALLIFPLLVQGMLTRCFVRGEYASTDEDLLNQSPTKQHPRTSALNATITLPHLGRVHVTIRYGEKSVAMIFGLEAAEKVASLQSRLSRLEKRLIRRGYLGVSLTAQEHAIRTQA